MQTLDNFNFAGKKAFVRVDFNVPLEPEPHRRKRPSQSACEAVMCPMKVADSLPGGY